MTRLRLGVLLIVFSWLPIAQVVLWIAHSNQHLTSEQASSTFRLTIWGVQIVIGLVGVWAAGKLAIQAARAHGWRQTPVELWQLFRDGDSKELN